jgi:hypothetical protein
VRLRFAGFAHTDGYDGPSGQWSPGDEREVDAAEGARLLSDFGPAFSLVEAPPPVQTVVVSRPPQHRGHTRKG